MDVLVDGTTGTICIQDGIEDELLESLMELEITAPLHSDDEFSVLLDVRAGSNNTNVLESTVVDVTVLAVADIPSVAAPQIVTVEEQGSEIIALSVNSSLDDADDDNSECIFVRLTVASDPTTGDPIGLLSPVATVPGVSFTSSVDNVYNVNATGAVPSVREVLLDTFFAMGLVFTPGPNQVGTFVDAVQVDVISEEKNGVAPSNNPDVGTGNDLDTRYEIATANITIIITRLSLIHI